MELSTIYKVDLHFCQLLAAQNVQYSPRYDSTSTKNGVRAPHPQQKSQTLTRFAICVTKSAKPWSVFTERPFYVFFAPF